MKLVTAELASSASVRSTDSTPTSRPANTDCRSCRVLTVRATAARYAATLRLCSCAPECKSYVGLWSRAGSGGAPAYGGVSTASSRDRK
eukprot:3245593-Alexandrium_andersonii.AAC.1